MRAAEPSALMKKKKRKTLNINLSIEGSNMTPNHFKAYNEKCVGFLVMLPPTEHEELHTMSLKSHQPIRKGLDVTLGIQIPLTVF